MDNLAELAPWDSSLTSRAPDGDSTDFPERVSWSPDADEIPENRRPDGADAPRSEGGPV